MQTILGRLLRLLDQPGDLFKPTSLHVSIRAHQPPKTDKHSRRIRRIAHHLINQTLARRDPRALLPQAMQRNIPLLGITTTNRILHNPHAMPIGNQVQRRLQHTDMCLNPNNHDVKRLLLGRRAGVRIRLRGRQRLERRHHLGHPHAKGRLVHVRDGRVGRLELQLGARLAQLGALLRRREDGYLEDLGGAQDFLRGGDDDFVLVNRRAEFLLQVADAVWFGSMGCVRRVGLGKRTRLPGFL